MEKYRGIDEFIFEGIKRLKRKVTIVILTTKLGSKKAIAPTARKLEQLAKKRDLNCIVLDTEKGKIEKTEKGSFLISNQGERQHEIYLDSTVISTRRSSIENNASKIFFKKLEDHGFVCVNSYNSVIMCEDKLQTTRKLEETNIPVPKTALISSEEDIDKSVEEIGGKYPLVCKFLSGTKGIGVFMIDSRPSLVSTLQAIWSLSPQTEILVQEKIEAEYDLRIHVLAENEGSSTKYRVIAAMKRLKIEGDFRTNFSLGGKTETIELPKNITKIAINSAKAVGCMWCGVDIIVDKETGDPYVLEVNASPGTDGIEKCTGVNVSEIILEFLLNRKNWIKPKKVTGFRELFTIKGVGSIVGKLDTGNGSTACSLHADEIKEKDSKVEWTIGDKSYINDIIGYSETEVGSIVHKRAVVELDIEFEGSIYKKVKFSLVDRTMKSTPLLLNRDFLTTPGMVVDPSQDFLLTDKPEEYTPYHAKGNPDAGIDLI